MFPHQLTDGRAFDVAQALLEGFNKHYRLFREASRAAKGRFEDADWHGQQRGQRERIEFYDRRVDEAVERLQKEFDIGHLSMDSWQQAKLHYIGLLTNHHQPELAETFFNSVTTKILHRSYFNNDFIFVRPAISTEYIENDEPASLPTYRAYYPTRDTLRDTLLRIVTNFQLKNDFEDLGRDVDQVLAALRAHTGEVRLRTNYQIQVLSSLFFRNKGAYVVGKIVNGFSETPFALPILHTSGRRLLIDIALFGEDDLLMLFSFARAYFMVEMEVPSAPPSTALRQVIANFNCNSRLDDVLTLGGRLGLGMGHWMPYLSGGYASARVSTSGSPTGRSRPAASPSSSGARAATAAGILGGGLDWHIANGWTIGIDYKHFEFDAADEGSVRDRRRRMGSVAQ